MLVLLAGTAMALVTAAILPLAGGASAQENARVRVVHASPDAPPVDVYANGNVVLTNVPFNTASDYLSVPPGDYNVQVFAAGADPASDTAVIDADATLDAGKDYTVVALGTLDSITAGVFVDDNTAPAAGKAHVRVIHASPDAPAVDIAVAGGPVLVPGLAFGQAAGPLPVDAGTYDLEVRAAGTETVALAIDGVTLEQGKIYTVIAVGLLNGQPPLSALTIADEPALAGGAPAAGTTPEAGTLPTSGTGSAEEGSAAWLLAGAIALVGVATAGAGAALAVRRTR